MKEHDEVIYTIMITGIETLSKQDAIVKELPNFIGTGKMEIGPATKTAPGLIDIPRLFTTWRGNDAEKAWQERLTEAVKEHNASIAIDVQPWNYAPGYPQGDTEL
jgi:hypothetical protein